jgi:hypothetical protein
MVVRTRDGEGSTEREEVSKDSMIGNAKADREFWASHQSSELFGGAQDNRERPGPKGVRQLLGAVVEFDAEFVYLLE